LSIDIIWKFYPDTRVNGVDAGCAEHIGFVIRIIIAFLSSLRANGYLSVLREWENTVSRRYKSNGQMHGDITYGFGCTAYIKAKGKW